MLGCFYHNVSLLNALLYSLVLEFIKFFNLIADILILAFTFSDFDLDYSNFVVLIFTILSA